MITQTDEGNFVSEASEMGWEPGFWPLRFHADGIGFKLVRTEPDGTRIYVTTNCNYPHTLVVFND